MHLLDHVDWLVYFMYESRVQKLSILPRKVMFLLELFANHYTM